MKSNGQLSGMSFLSVREASGLLHIAIQTLANWRVLGTGPRFHKFGRRVFYTEQEIKDWADRQLRNNTQEGGG